MQDIQKQHYSLTQSNGKTIVTLRPACMPEFLRGKLCDDDIKRAMKIMNRSMQMGEIRTQLMCGCHDTPCPLCQERDAEGYNFRSIPNGSEKAKIMFVKFKPSEYEELAMYSHCDRCGTFLSLVLDKNAVDRRDIYFTDMVKCHAQLEERICRPCIESYFLKEIYLVDPTIIAFNGLEPLTTLISLGYVTGLQGMPVCGTIYEVSITGSNEKRRVIALDNLNTVLKTEGAELDAAKVNWWKQVCVAFNELKRIELAKQNPNPNSQTQ